MQLNFLFFIRDQIGRADFVDLVAKQIELLLASRLHCVERGVLCEQRLQLTIMLSIFGDLLFGARKRIEQA